MRKPDNHLIFSRMSDLCAVFSDEKRLRILWYLNSSERRVNEIADFLDISIQNASQHLRLMKDRGAVMARRDGHAVYYRITNMNYVAGLEIIREALVEEMGNLGKIK